MRNFIIYSFIGLCIVLVPIFVSAQTIHQDEKEVISARVVSVKIDETRIVPGTDIETPYQEVQAVLTSGSREGEIISFINDFIVLAEGDTIFVNRISDVGGNEFFTFHDLDRRSALFFWFLLFICAVVGFSGWQGVRSLVSLALSFGAIGFIMVPLLLQGYSPVWISVLVASFILFFAIFFTHGINRESLSAFLGTSSAVILTGLLSVLAVRTVGLSGFGSDEAVYLNVMTGGVLDVRGLLLGGILIGVLGVLDDISITQAAVVSELKAVARNLSLWDMYRRALRVGREHIGALVNTLALAYAGASLPLLMLFSLSPASFDIIVNQELVAGEVIRTLVGSIGLMLAVPLTTVIAIYLVKPYDTSDMSHHVGHHHHH